MNHRTALTGCIIIAGLAVTACGYQPVGTNSASQTTQRPTTRATLPATTRATLPGIGQPARDGDFEFVIHRVYRPDRESIRGEPLGEWLAVDMSVKNIKTDSGSFFATNQVLIVDDAEYEPGYSSDSIIDINPGLQTDVSVIYDVHPSVFNRQSLILELHDSMFSGGVQVEIHRSDW